MDSLRYQKIKKDLRGKIRPLMNGVIVDAVQAADEDISPEDLAGLISLALGGKAPWSVTTAPVAGEILREEAARLFSGEN